MTEEIKDSSGVPPVDPADTEGNQVPDPADSDTVSRRAYSKALTEKKAAQSRLKEKELEDAEAIRSQAQLEENGSLQEKIDFYKTKNEEFTSTVSNLQSELSFEKNKWGEVRKVSACQDALPFNVPSKYFVHLDTDSILLDPETGLPDPASVQKTVDMFQKEHPELIAGFAPKGKSYSEFPKANLGGGKISLEDWKKLPYDEKMKQRANIQ